MWWYHPIIVNRQGTLLMKVKVHGFTKIRRLGEVSDVKPVNRFLTGLQNPVFWPACTIFRIPELNLCQVSRSLPIIKIPIRHRLYLLVGWICPFNNVTEDDVHVWSSAHWAAPHHCSSPLTPPEVPGSSHNLCRRPSATVIPFQLMRPFAGCGRSDCSY